MDIIYNLIRGDYYRKRSTLQILYRILTTRSNSEFTDMFCLSEDNLKFFMTALREEDSAHIKIEVFYVFAVILQTTLGYRKRHKLRTFKILDKNRPRLIAFLERFQADYDNEDFQNDRLDIINSLKEQD